MGDFLTKQNLKFQFGTVRIHYLDWILETKSGGCGG